jgi:glycerophosphoryl diester phosphodiesterase
MAAFELAARQGADGIEFDVHLSTDNIPIVIHDTRLNRTTSGKGFVRAYRAADLRRLDAGSWFNRRHPQFARARYANEKIPLLSEVLAWIHKRGLHAYLEIKLGGEVYPGIEARVLDEIARAGVASRMTIISFDLPTLQRLRRLSPTASLGIDVTRPVLALRGAREIQASLVLPHWRFASRRFIRRAHRAGIQVIAWNVEQERAMRRKLADGVDGIVTGWPALASGI